MDHISGRDLRERAFQFTCESSIGANLEEAKASYSRKEFAAKNAISFKESRESKYWLRVAEAKALGDRDRRRHLLRESDEFVAMLTTGVKRLQVGPRREM
jgi:four helix bundle protein